MDELTKSLVAYLLISLIGLGLFAMWIFLPIEVFWGRIYLIGVFFQIVNLGQLYKYSLQDLKMEKLKDAD